jgi:hypothetical protein
MSLARLLTGDTVSVRTYEGETAYGPSYGPQVAVDCRVEHQRKLVRNTAGDEVVSETTVYVLPTVQGVRTVDLFPPESLVEHDGRTSHVISCASHRGQGPAVFVEVVLTGGGAPVPVADSYGTGY